MPWGQTRSGIPCHVGICHPSSRTSSSATIWVFRLIGFVVYDSYRFVTSTTLTKFQDPRIIFPGCLTLNVRISICVFSYWKIFSNQAKYKPIVTSFSRCFFVLAAQGNCLGSFRVLVWMSCNVTEPDVHDTNWKYPPKILSKKQIHDLRWDEEWGGVLGEVVGITVGWF